MTYHVFVQFDVPSNKRDAFVEAALFNAASVENEPGTLRFEVIRDEFNRNRFYFDEVYQDEESFLHHCTNDRLQKFMESIDEYAYGPVILFKGYKVSPR